MRQESSETGQGLHVLVHLLIIPATKIVSNIDSKRVTISSIDVRKNNQVETYAISVYIYNIIYVYSFLKMKIVISFIIYFPIN